MDRVNIEGSASVSNEVEFCLENDREHALEK